MKNKSVLMRVVSDIGRSRALIAVSLLLSAASVVFNLYIPVLAGDAIDGMTGGKVDNERTARVNNTKDETLDDFNVGAMWEAWF